MGDHQTIAFEATALNILNQRSVTAYWAGMDSLNFATPLYPGQQSLYSGAPMYQELESGYNVQQWINGNNGQVPKVFKNSEYGQPTLFQLARSMRLGVRFTF